MVRRIKPSIPEIFVPVDKQVENLKKWNQEYDLGFGEEDFDRITGITCSYDPEEPLKLPVLYLCLDTPFLTFQKFWEILKAKEASIFVPGELERIELLPDMVWNRGLFGECIDLGADQYHNCAVNSESLPRHLIPHFSVIAAAAHFKDWIQNMGGAIPFVWIPGLTVKAPDCQEKYALFLYSAYPRGKNRKQIYIGVAPEDSEWQGYAVPEVLERLA